MSAPSDSSVALVRLASALCQDSRIRVNVSKDTREWSWDPQGRIITISQVDIDRYGAKACLGIVAHEVGHFWVTRDWMFDRTAPLPIDSAAAILQNCIEDPRADTYIRTRFVGVGPWLAQAARAFKRDQLLVFRPAFEIFCYECVDEGEMARLFQPRDATAPLPPAVRLALDATRAARCAYANEVPRWSGGQGGPGREEVTRYWRDVRLRIRSAGGLPSFRELTARLSAWDALQLAQAQIEPAAQRLLQGDVARLTAHLTANPAERARATQCVEQRDTNTAIQIILALWRSSTEEPPQSTSATHSRPLTENAHSDPTRRITEEMTNCVTIAWKLFEFYYERRARERLQHGLTGRTRRKGTESGSSRSRGVPRVTIRSGGHSRHPSRSSRAEASLPTRSGADLRDRDLKRMLGRIPELEPCTYDSLYRDAAPQIAHLRRRFEAVLRPLERVRWEPGYWTGGRPDLRRVMALDACPSRPEGPWERKQLPQRPSAVVSVLVDLSGSMRGHIDVASRGVVAITETLERLDVAHWVGGFQDVVIPLKEFDERLTPTVKRRLAEMRLEVSGTRPKGNNQPYYNDDGPVLLKTADILLREAMRLRASRRQTLLFFLSDGSPEGKSSDAEDLERAVLKLAAEPLEIFAIGMGTGTNHVEHFFEHAVGDVALEDLANVLGRRLLAALR